MTKMDETTMLLLGAGAFLVLTQTDLFKGLGKVTNAAGDIAKGVSGGFNSALSAGSDVYKGFQQQAAAVAQGATSSMPNQIGQALFTASPMGAAAIGTSIGSKILSAVGLPDYSKPAAAVAQTTRAVVSNDLLLSNIQSSAATQAAQSFGTKNRTNAGAAASSAANYAIYGTSNPLPTQAAQQASNASVAANVRTQLSSYSLNPFGF